MTVGVKRKKGASAECGTSMTSVRVAEPGQGDAGRDVVLSDGLLTDRDRNAASGAPVQIDGTDVRARAAPRRHRDHRRTNPERTSHATPHFV